MQREIRVLADAAAIAKCAAKEFVEAARTAVRERNVFQVVLAGGSTPKALYDLLASDPALRSQIPWDKTQVFSATNATSVPIIQTAISAWPRKRCSPKFR